MIDFSGNLIWRISKNINFGGFLTNSPNPPKFLPLRYSDFIEKVKLLHKTGKRKQLFVINTVVARVGRP